jgi:ribosome maturation factor RimP
MDSNNTKVIKDLVFPILESRSVDLIDIELKGGSGSQLLRIIVDVDGGITLDQCVQLSREISDLLDTQDLITGRYRLEVSSPGLDRPLKTERDFKRNLGRKVRINYLSEQNEHQTIIGVIEVVKNNQVVVLENSQQVQIDLSKISVAKIMPVW